LKQLENFIAKIDSASDNSRKLRVLDWMTKTNNYGVIKFIEQEFNPKFLALIRVITDPSLLIQPIEVIEKQILQHGSRLQLRD